MNPALTTIQNDVRAADLRERAARRNRTSGKARRASKEIETAQSAPAYAPSPLFQKYGFFGREHGSHA